MNPEKKILFNIKHLECGYPNKENKDAPPGIPKVLQVGPLKIYKGEFVVLLGNSGSGKSTLLETLGLMANRIIDGDVEFYPGTDTEPVNYLDGLWKNKVGGQGQVPVDTDKITRIRRGNFNFIFQENNLMPNFTNSENIVIADLIDNTKERKSSYGASKEELISVNLPPEFGDKYPQNISGGERQRVAFARATLPKCNVLFGDEPTGNLDEKNADDLMGIIKKKVNEDQDKTAIIVSHNIELSLKYADRIILLTPAKNNTCYEIIEGHVLIKKAVNDIEKWVKYKNGTDHKHVKEETLSEIREEIKFLLENGSTSKLKNTPVEKKVKKSLLISLMTGLGLWLMKVTFGFEKGLPKGQHENPHQKDNGNGGKIKLPRPFAKLFLEKECGQLVGKGNRNFFVFAFAIFITLMIIGFANGQLNELRTEMNDPFVNTVDVLHKGGSAQGRIDAILDGLMGDSVRSQFGIDTIYKYNTFSFPFVDYSGGGEKMTYLDGRTIPYNDPILDKIMDAENNPVGRKFTNPHETGIIITRDMLKKLGHGAQTGFLPFPRKQGGVYYDVPLPVLAIVDRIPESKYIGKNYFLCTPNFYDNYRKLGAGFLIPENERLKLLLSTSRTGFDQPAIGLLGGCSRSPLGHDDVLDETFVKDFETTIGKALAQLNETDGEKFTYSLYTEPVDISGISHAIEITVTRTPRFSGFAQQQAFFEMLIRQEPVRRFMEENEDSHLFQTYFSNTVRKPYQYERDNIAINFEDAKKIREFADEFKNRTGLELDDAKVENMHTFYKVSRMTNTILVILIAFSVMALMLYISNLTNMHLYKIRKNIGTLKAFGTEVHTIFQVLMVTFVTISLLLPGILVTALEILFNLTGLLSFSLISQGDAPLFTGLTVALIYIGAYIVYYFARKKYFALNPSDLIYSREG